MRYVERNRYIFERGDSIRIEDIEWDVAESCGQSLGWWYCITHDERFAKLKCVVVGPSRNCLPIHVDDQQEHHLTWWCDCHGPEEPPI